MKEGNAGPGSMIQWLVYGKAVHFELESEISEGNIQNVGGKQYRWLVKRRELGEQCGDRCQNQITLKEGRLK